MRPSVRYVPVVTIVRSRFQARAAGVVCAALAAGAMAQVVPLSDLRRATVSARSGPSIESSVAAPQSVFENFATPEPFAALAASGVASVSAQADQMSGLGLMGSAWRLWGVGHASATGITSASDTGSSQASSSYYVTIQLDSPMRIDVEATLGGGPVSGGQFILQGAGGQVSYFFTASSPQPIRLTRVLPAGQYTVVAYAGAAISLYPQATLSDGAWFDFAADFVALCPGDFNRDGFVDGFDYDDFVACFEGVGGACPQGVTADFNADGFVDGFDYDEFVAAFESACP